MGDEKPFSCTAPGCGQRFTNEDHLAVHRHKHEMTLKLGPARNDSVIVADQTPTPTRFLKNCEEVGLFHELASPLEPDFRKGADEDPRKLPLDLSPLAGPVTRSKMEESSMAESPRLSPVPHPESTTGSDQEGPVVPPQPAAPRPISLHIPGVLLANSDTNAPASPAANSVLTPVPSPSRTIVPVSSSFPLLLQLPNGQTMPVALSASIANPAAHIPTALPLAGPVAVVPSLPGVPGPASPQPVQSEAKMVTSSEPVDAPSPAPPEELCAQSLQQPATSTTETAASPPPPARRISCTGGRRRRASNDDPDEKRRKFLERNRAAASRCRQKRKVWVQALEKKAEDLDSLNSLLQSEVTQLRTEVAQLKQLLVAHEDCPVTAMLRKSGCHSEGAASPSSSPPAEVIQHSSVSTSNGIGSSSGPLAGLEPVPSLQAAQPEVGLEPPAEAPPTQS